MQWGGRQGNVIENGSGNVIWGLNMQGFIVDIKSLFHGL